MSDAKKLVGEPTPAQGAQDTLLGAPFADFVATRDRLVGERRRAGDKEGAAAIKKLPKPVRSVWATNKAVRRSPEAVARLLDLADALAEAQLLAKSADGRQRFQEMTAAHRLVINELVASARQALTNDGQSAPPALLDQVANNFRFGAINREARDDLAHGRLLHDVEAPGFGVWSGPTDAGASDDKGDREVNLGRPREAHPVTAPRPVGASPAALDQKRNELAARKAELVAARKHRDHTVSVAKKAAALSAEAQARVHTLEVELAAARTAAERAQDAQASADTDRSEAEAAEQAAAARADEAARDLRS